MAAISRGLPERPHLDIPKREARGLLELWRKADPVALERIRGRHPKFRKADDSAIANGPFKLSDAQLVIAREYGFAHWTELKQRVEMNSVARDLATAIRADDREAAVRLVNLQPGLLHVPLISGNWGPPMSHAANLGRLELIQAMAKLGAKDFQHAFDRAILQGQIECARWLHANGATLQPGIIMGACETLNIDGFRFLAEANAPFTDHTGNRLAPLALVLETYSRRPETKHQILNFFAHRGYSFPDTPMMALHRGDLRALENYLKRDPHLLERCFSLREIFPAECGCGEGGRTGMYWTPIDGGTLLHVAIDFREHEIIDWLLKIGADPNARAAVDSAGFGGHTPLFNAVVCGPWPDASLATKLLKHGAEKNERASLRKFLDWIDIPRWHEARDVTPREWADGFPERNWINTAAVQALG